MLIESKPITGMEPVTDEDCLPVRDPRCCLIAFYRAFNGRDLPAMERNWSQSTAASMSNPLGDVKRGWSAIRRVYENIFFGSARVYVEFYDYSLHHGTDMLIAVGRERGYVAMAGERIDLMIRTTRIFQRESAGWRQLHHHGSIDDALLLARYQDIVRKRPAS